MLQAKRRLHNHSIDYLRLGTIFAWFYTENEKPSVTNEGGFIVRSSKEYFKRDECSSREIKAMYNAWTKDIGGARRYALNLRRKCSVQSVLPKHDQVSVVVVVLCVQCVFLYLISLFTVVFVIIHAKILISTNIYR